MRRTPCRASRPTSPWWRRGAFGASVLLAVLVPAAVLAQIEVRASVSSDRVRVGESFTLSVTATGSQSVAAPALANLDGFQARYVGPSTQVSIVNGQMSASVEHRYALTAQREGEFVLGPFTVAHAGQVYETNTVRVAVGAGVDVGDSAGESLRLVLEVPRPQVFLHERVPVEVTLYVGDVTARDVHFPALQASGVSIESFAQPSRATQVIDGRRYEVLRFRGAIVPLQAGRRALGPATMNLNLVQQQRHFFFAQRQAVELRSNAVDLDVLPLPAAGRPQDFSGAVGRFALEVAATPLEVDAGDPITVHITLRGDGNFASVTPPSYTDAPGLRVYAPQLVESGDPSMRQYEQVVIPESGAFDLLPSLRLAYFDPNTRAYALATGPAIAVQVRDSALAPGVAESTLGPGDAAGARQRRESLGRDIVYIKDHAGPLLDRHERAARWWWLLLWQPLPLLFYAGVVLYDRHRRRLSSDERYARSTRAGRAVRRTLADAEKALDAGETKRFFDAFESGLRDYLSARLGLPPGAIDAERLAAAGVAENTRLAVNEIFATCEQARFAPSADAAAPRDLLERARTVVADLERRRGWRLG